MAGFKVRPAYDRDLHDCVVLTAKTLAASPTYRDLGFDKEKTLLYLDERARNDLLLVARDDDGALLGFLCAYITPTQFSYSRIAYEDAVFVAEEARGRGVGKSLYLHFLAWGKEQGAERIRAGVTTAINETTAIKTLTGAGFEVMGVIAEAK